MLTWRYAIDVGFEMTVRLHDVFIAIEIDINKERAEGQHAACRCAVALTERFIAEARCARRSHIKRTRFVREIADGDGEFSSVAQPCCIDAHRAC